MRILLTSHVFFPDGGGGVGRYVESVATELIARGHEVAVLTTRSNIQGGGPGATHADDEWRGIPVRRLSFNLQLAPQPYRFEWDNPWVNPKILEYAAARRADVVHVAHAGRLSLSAVPLLKAAGYAVVGQVHDYWLICALSNLRRVDGQLCDGPSWLDAECTRCVLTRPWTRQDALTERVRGASVGSLLRLGRAALDDGRAGDGHLATIRAQATRLHDVRAYLSHLDALLCPSPFVADILRRNGLDLPNLRIMPLGITFPEPAPAPDAAPGDGVLRVGFLGRMEPMKGIHVLVDAVRSLPPELPVRLELFGTEDDPDYCADLRARAAGDERIRLRGPVPSASEALPELDVLVLPSVLFEVYPLVIREAQALGIPAVVSDIGGMKDAVRHEVDGLHFTMGDAASLADQLRRLVEERGLLARLRANVRAPLGIEGHVDELEALYRGLAGRAEPAAGVAATAGV